MTGEGDERERGREGGEDRKESCTNFMPVPMNMSAISYT